MSEPLKPFARLDAQGLAFLASLHPNVIAAVSRHLLAEIPAYVQALGGERHGYLLTFGESQKSAEAEAARLKLAREFPGGLALEPMIGERLEPRRPAKLSTYARHVADALEGADLDAERRAAERRLSELARQRARNAIVSLSDRLVRALEIGGITAGLPGYRAAQVATVVRSAADGIREGSGDMPAPAVEGAEEAGEA
jgi:hypothetical protein